MRKMRSHILVVFILFAVNVQTFLIDDFRSAMHHIENGFEKLLSDVVNDMEETLDCTISAIEHVLIINSILDKNSDFNKRCTGEVNAPSILNVKDSDHRMQMEASLDKLPGSAYNSEDNNSRNIISQDLHNSIANVNRTLHNILSKKGGNDTRDDVLEPLRDGSNRLSEVSILLRKELEKISWNVKRELEKINFIDESPEALVLDEIQILRKVENETDTSDVRNLHHIVGSALNILKSNNNTNFERSNNQMEKIIKELENADINVRSESVERKDHDANIINKDFLHISHEENKHILEDKILNTKFDSPSSDYVSSIFDSFSSVNEENKAEQEAINLINESKFTNILFKDENIGSDVFGNTNLFNF